MKKEVNELFRGLDINRALKRKEDIRKTVMFVMSSIGNTSLLARNLGIDRDSCYYWWHGICLPTDPVIINLFEQLEQRLRAGLPPPSSLS